MFCIKIIYFVTHIKVKNNKMLFNSRNWFKFAPLILNSDSFYEKNKYQFILVISINGINGINGIY